MNVQNLTYVTQQANFQAYSQEDMETSVAGSVNPSDGFFLPPPSPTAVNCG